MKKYSVLIAMVAGLYLSSAHAETITISGIVVDFKYEKSKTASFESYQINGVMTVPSGNEKKSCDFNGLTSYYGNYGSGIFQVCGDYIVRMNTEASKENNPRQGYSFRIVTEVDLRNQTQYKVLGKKFLETRFVEAQTIEANAEKDTKIDKH